MILFCDTSALVKLYAVQLASADHLARHGGQPGKFACIDRRLNKAAAALGMDCI